MELRPSALPFATTLAVLLTALMGFMPTSAFAQEEVVPTSTGLGYTTERIIGDEVIGDFVVGPGKTEVSINPGESRVAELIVTNRTGERRRFNLEIEDAAGSQNPEQSVVLLGNDRGPYSLKDYIKLPVTTFELDHTERARIPVTISIPADAEPGGLYGSVLVNTVAVEGEAGSTAGAAPQSAIITRIGSLFFVRVPGDVDASGELKDFSTAPDRTWFNSGPINFQLLYSNTGSVHLNPYGEISITNMLGEEVGFIQLDPWFALPDSLRLREVAWDRTFLMGKYTATAQINRGYEDVVDTMQTTFWVIPWKLAVGVFVILFGVIYLMRTFLRTFEFKRRG